MAAESQINHKTFCADTLITQQLRNIQLERQIKFSKNDQSLNQGFYSITGSKYCIRRSKMTRGIPMGLNDEALRRVTMGNIMQDYVDGLMIREYGRDLTKIERSITQLVDRKKKVYLTGRIDHLPTFRIKGNFRYYYPIEAKYKIDKLVKDMKEVPKDYLFQPNLYMANMGATEGSIYFVDHHLRAKTFHLELDNDIIDEAYDRTLTLHDYVVHDELPPAEAMYSDEKWLKSQCWFCPVKNECNKIERK